MGSYGGGGRWYPRLGTPPGQKFARLRSKVIVYSVMPLASTGVKRYPVNGRTWNWEEVPVGEGCLAEGISPYAILLGTV